MEMQLLPYRPPPGVCTKDLEKRLGREYRPFVGVLQCTSGALLGDREDRLGILLKSNEKSPLFCRWYAKREGIASLQNVDANDLQNVPKKQIFLAIMELSI